MKKILIINGPNLNMLGKRDKNQYGSLTLKEINKLIKKSFPNTKFYFFQSNSESKIINKIHKIKNIDGLIINLGAFTHTSIAIRDALEIINIPIVEVHLSNINEREDFRQINYVKDIVIKSFYGEKEKSYLTGVKYLLDNI